jgi:hypothetical protein
MRDTGEVGPYAAAQYDVGGVSGDTDDAAAGHERDAAGAYRPD